MIKEIENGDRWCVAKISHVQITREKLLQVRSSQLVPVQTVHVKREGKKVLCFQAPQQFVCAADLNILFISAK